MAGHGFQAGDYVPGKPPGQANTVSAMIVTRAFARRLYPGHPDHVVGRNMYFGSGLMNGQPTRIVGVVAHLHKANVSNDGSGDQSVLLPVEPNDGTAMFALRSEPSQRGKVMKEAVAALNKNNPDRQVSADDAQTYTHMRESYFRGDTTMIRLLLASALGLLFVTALGIAGLASFWVQQRTRTIGIRRAIGATRGDILRYFQTENFLIVGPGRRGGHAAGARGPEPVADAPLRTAAVAAGLLAMRVRWCMWAAGPAFGAGAGPARRARAAGGGHAERMSP